MDAKKPRSPAVAGLVAGALVAGCQAPAGGDRPAVPGAAFGERVRFRCDNGQGFLATFYGAPRPVCVIEAGDAVTYELPLVSQGGGTTVYSNGTLRLTLRAYPQAELFLGPGETYTNCEGIPAGP